MLLTNLEDTGGNAGVAEDVKEKRSLHVRDTNGLHEASVD